MVYLVWTFVALVAVSALSRAAHDDDNKPYKFGFNIEKYQHRLEEKNKKGLVKGEFGFVTGDGVYHETAYATDENGDFKILGMRSYFVGLPGQDLPDITKGAPPARTTPKPQQPAAPTALSGTMGCSGCLIPDRATQPAGSGSQGDGAAGNGNGPFSRQPSAFGGPGEAERPSKPNGGIAVGNIDLRAGKQSKPKYTSVDDDHANIKVGGFTPEDMRALLYRFNYTLGFHGHHETGDRAGHKQGGYHFDGRDGLERRVAYTANEFGFQPNITLHELPAQDTPREDTERGPEHGLKGYEFVWFNGRRTAQQKATRPATQRALQR